MATNSNTNNVIAKVLTTLNNSKNQVKDNALYQAVKALIGISRNLNESINNNSIAINNITGGASPSNTVEDLDGTGDAGVAILYSRGDHKHEDVNRPTNDEKAALVGTVGTPSSINKYVTDLDPRLLGPDPINPFLLMGG